MWARAFSVAPTGTNFLVGGYSYSEGAVSLDSSLPATDVEAQINTESIGYSRFFVLGNRTASFSAIVPTFDADISGNVGGDSKKIDRTGVGDMRFRISSNLIGGPAMNREEFALRTPETTLGFSTTILAPTGEYKSERLINIGANRWGIKPELGISQPVGDWFVEGSAGVWFFSDNENYFGGRTRKQDPIGGVQMHLGYNFRPGLWIAANANYWLGGQTTIDQDIRNDKQSSSRYGLTFSIPLSQSFSIKTAWSDGLKTRIGGDFNTFLLVLQYFWFDQ